MIPVLFPLLEVLYRRRLVPRRRRLLEGRVEDRGKLVAS
jgi:hypothetical protein